MTSGIRRNSNPGTLDYRAGILVSLLILGIAPLARAHQDPPACSTVGVTLELTVFRADGTTPVGNGTISPCETLVYQATLSDPAGDCAFEGGDLFITTADGVKHNVNPASGIPCLGGTGAEPSCPAGQTSVKSQQLTFQVMPQFITATGFVGATAQYGDTANGACVGDGTCGTSHNIGALGCTSGTPACDTLDSVSGLLPSSVKVQRCPASTACLTSVCDPNLLGTGVNTGRKGLCTTMVNPGGSTCASPVVGAAGDCTVLELDGSKVDITGPPGGIVGDVCIGPNGHLSITGSEFVTGKVRLSSGATFSKSGSGTVGGVQTGVDLSTEINAAIAASANAAGKACTVNLTSIMNTTTINATGGGTQPTVVCVKDVVLQAGKVLTLSGVAGDSFIFNVTGQFVLNGARIVASGVQPKDVLYNIIGSGPQVAFTGGGGGSGCCNASVDGTLLALKRDIALSPGLVNGELIGGQNISIASGSSVKCPPSPCVP